MGKIAQQNIKKGDIVVAIRPAQSPRWSSSAKPKGFTGKVYFVYGDGTFRFSPYGDKFLVADFEVTTLLKAAEAAVVKIDDQLKALNKRREAAVAKVDALKNPPWKVGDKFILSGPVAYNIHAIDKEVVTYKSRDTGNFYAKDRSTFDKHAVRI